MFTLLPTASAAASDTCDLGLKALERGDLDAARVAFENPTTDLECSAAGLTVLNARITAATAALKDCTDLITKSEGAAQDEADQVLEQAAERCAVASSLNPGLSDAGATLKKVRDLQAKLDEPKTTTDVIEDFSSSAWDITMRLLAVLGTWLVALALALPLLALLQLAVGRAGRTNLAEVRLALRRVPLLRFAAEVLLAVAILGVLIAEGSFPWWAAGSLGAAVAGLGIWGAVWSTDPDTRLMWGLVPFAFGGVFIVALLALPKGNALVVIAGVLLLLTMLAWVRAQTSSLRIGPFGDTAGKMDPPGVFGPLVAAEIVRLGKSGRASIDIVDSPLATQAFDADSLNALAGPESKLAGVLYKFLAIVARPSDYAVTGYLVEETSRGVGVTMQLKRGPRLVSAVTLYAQEFRLGSATAEDPDSDETKAPDANAEKSEQGDAEAKGEGAKHPELASAAACWVLATFTTELADRTAVRDALRGSEDWRSDAYQAVGTRSLEAGLVKAAAELYALAVDRDRDNLSARFGLAQARGRMPRAQESLQLGALDTAASDAIEILKAAPPEPGLRLQCAYLYVAALANRNAIAEDDTLRVRIAQAIAINDASAEPEKLVAAELGPILAEEAVLPTDPVQRRLHELTTSSLAALKIEFGSSLAALKIEFGGGRPSAATALLVARAQKTIRGQYNLAALYARLLPNSDTLRLQTLALLENVALVPELAAFALADPYFKSLRNDPAFREVIGTSEAVDRASGLGEFILIGKDRANRLAKGGIRSFATLVEKSNDDIREALEEEIPDHVIDRWKLAAELDEVPGVGIRSINLLVVAGVGSRAELGNRNAQALSEILDAIAGGLGRTQSPSPETVQVWISSAA